MVVKTGKNTNWRIKLARKKAQQSATTARYEKHLGVKLGFQIADAGTLSRSASNALRGKSAGASGAAGRQVAIVQTNQALYDGRITPAQYARTMQIAVMPHDKEIANQAAQRRRVAVVSATSEGIKQKEKHEIAENQGKAIGTIQKDGSTISVQNSQTSKTNTVLIQSPDKIKESIITQQKQQAQPPKEIQLKAWNEKIEKPSQNIIMPNYLYSVEFTEGGKPKQAAVLPPLTLSQYAQEYDQRQNKKFTPQLQDYPRSNELSKDNPLNFFKGVYYGGALPLAQVVLTPIGLVTGLAVGKKIAEPKTNILTNYQNIIKTIQDPIPAGKTLIGESLNQVITGQPLHGTGEGGYYDLGSVSFDVASAVLPLKGSFAKISPVKVNKFNMAGVEILATETSKKIKTPIGTPAIITKTVKPIQVSLGYGSKNIPLISKVGNKLTKGDVDLSNVSVKITASTGKQGQRGVKMAADSSQFEQTVAKKLIPKISGIDNVSVRKAEVIEGIVKIVTKPKKDTIVSKSLPDEAFTGVTKTEQPSLILGLKTGQKAFTNKLGPYEGSLSQQYFVQPRFMRQSGDVDLHASSYDRAAKQIDRIQPKLKADPNREFISITNPKTKSAKIYEKSSKEKIIEILNPEETDLKGVSQSVEGSTLFGKSIPSTKYKVDEGVTFGRQRQILKKGESLYSIQTKDGKPSLGGAKFREPKDTADFYALGRSAQEKEFVVGSKDFKELGKLLDEFKGQAKKDGFDIDEYFKKNVKKITDSEKVTIRSEKSTLEKIGSSAGGIKQTSGGIQSISNNMIPKSIVSSTGKSLTPKTGNSLIKSTGDSTTKPSISTLIQSSIVLGLSVGGGSPPINDKTSTGPSLGGGKSPSGGSTGSSLTGGKGGKSSVSRGTLAKNAAAKTASYTKSQKRPILAIIDIRNTTKKTIGSPKKKHDFLGYTHVSEVMGHRTSKTDLTFGDKKTKRLYEKDVKFTQRKLKKSLKLAKYTGKNSLKL